MTELSAARELQPLEKFPARQAMPSKGRSWLRAKSRQSDLIIVVCFCLVGLLITFAAMKGMPNFSPTPGEITLTP